MARFFIDRPIFAWVLAIGVMLVGKMFGEETLIGLAAQLEQAHPWSDRKPEVW